MKRFQPSSGDWSVCFHTVRQLRVATDRLNLFIQLLGKVFVPGYFVKCVAVDASSKGPLPLWPGVWSAHENWHCVILCLHLTQLYALMTHYGTWTATTFYAMLMT